MNLAQLLALQLDVDGARSASLFCACFCKMQGLAFIVMIPAGDTETIGKSKDTFTLIRVYWYSVLWLTRHAFEIVKMTIYGVGARRAP